MTRLETVLALIDRANSADPNREHVDGAVEPAALLYSHRMSIVLAEFAPEASEQLAIAARGQHIERWRRPRADYPQGRVGYLAWRRDAGRFHANRVTELMSQAGYGQAARDRVSALVSKKGIKRDVEIQALEDVACLVFMRWYFIPFASGRTHDDLYRIVSKTAQKMSHAGRQAALALPLPRELAPAIVEANCPL